MSKNTEGCQPCGHTDNRFVKLLQSLLHGQGFSPLLELSFAVCESLYKEGGFDTLFKINLALIGVRALETEVGNSSVSEQKQQSCLDGAGTWTAVVIPLIAPPHLGYQKVLNGTWQCL